MSMKVVSKTITFRLSSLQWHRLAEAAERQGASPGELARRLVLDGLEDRGDGGVGRQIVELQDGLRRLHTALARATVVLLVDAGKCDERAANEWVTQELLKNHALDLRHEERTG